ncbi:cyclohexanecarboxylate-CoA ligase [Kibdelosporangium banguiense]|uniref:Cyclohexanecarboxylate-CoA ligase n=1 Tax=Kibdelosporangium banguiense TaxID=1365924 RepID=A0ABS4TRV9_9PSEU|nr:AMP-binding protein [Kibdelosporangium banguiense]MBP2327150.1 cyclohexanecarboxylate-CoA ligase [Kibdelosporangium banguiense]
MTIDPFDVRPPAWMAAHYRREGWWRDESILHDLVRAAASCPERPAIIAYRAETGRAVTVRYGELLRYVRRFTGGLIALGIRRGDAVAYQLPDWWETTALTLACMWIGAVAVPIQTSIRPRELELILTDARARLCVTAQTWQGAELAWELERMAPRLPQLRYRVVYGERPGNGAIDFTEHFLNTPHEDLIRRPPPLPSGAAMDEPRLLMFTSGTTGQRKSVLHTENSIYAGIGGYAEPVERGWDRHEVFCTPHPITGLAATLYSVWGSLLAHGTGVYQDVWDADRQLDLMASAGVTQLFAAPVFLSQMVEAQRRRRRHLPSLRLLKAGATPVPSKLVHQLADEFSVPIRSCWAMTEVGLGLRIREDDPDRWAAHSDGRPLPALATDLRPVPGVDGLYRLWVTGPSLGSAVWQTDAPSDRDVRALWDTDSGWFDTGDLVRHDGHGGLRFAGRANRRIGGMFMIPVEEVEGELREHPAVREVAVIGHAVSDGDEQPCAVVASRGHCPSLSDLRDFLTWRGMTEWYLPTKLIQVETLPRDACGKVSYDRLLTMLATANVS